MEYYSTESRKVQGPLAAGSQLEYVPVQGHFEVRTLRQTDVLDVMRHEPRDPYSLRTGFEVLLSEAVRKVSGAVGIMCFEEDQIGSCTLVGANLAIIPCHCIEGIAINQLVATFGRHNDSQSGKTFLGENYGVIGVVEYDYELDYALVLLGGAPGNQFGYGRIERGVEAVAEPFLLHHPIRKPLKVSLRGMVHCPYYTHFLMAYHDSDYGSSGGGYFDPKSRLVAMHIGSERHPMDWNLMRLGLPLSRIFEKMPYGILGQIADRKLNPDAIFACSQPWISLSPQPRQFIDMEMYDRTMMKPFGYIVRNASRELPGIIVDAHQSKHLSGWPSASGAGGGSKFPLNMTNDDLVLLAEVIGKNEKDFLNSGDEATVYPKKTWELNKSLLGAPLYKKLTNPPGRNGKKGSSVKEIGIEYAWAETAKAWEMHFFPQY